MRTDLSGTLLAHQKLNVGRKPYLDIQVGASHYYIADIHRISHTVEPHVNRAIISLDNADEAITNTDFKGNVVTFNMGYTTGAGNETSAGGTMKVRRQVLNTRGGKSVMDLYCYGIMSDMGMRGARARYIDTDATLTIKELITYICTSSGDTSVPFGQYTTVTITYDSEDSVIDTSMPGDSFRIYLNAKQLDQIKRLLDMTSCVIREESDGLHIFVPTTSGESYNYEYALSGEHGFLWKAKQDDCVLPNTVVVMNDPESTTKYSGEAEDATSVSAYGAVYYYHKFNGVTSDAECVTIATAILAKFKLYSSIAAIEAPVNVGLELWDYIKVTDSRDSTTMTGNVGHIHTVWEAGNFSQTISFGEWKSEYIYDLGSIGGEDGGAQYIPELLVDELYLNPITLDYIEDGVNYQRVNSGALNASGLVLMAEISGNLDDIDDGDPISGYSKTLATSVSAGRIYISGTTQYSAPLYNPTTKFDKGYDDLDDVPDGSTYKLIKVTDITDGHIKLTTYVTADGLWYANYSGVTLDAGSGMTLIGQVAIRFNSGGNNSYLYQNGSTALTLIGSGSEGLRILSTNIQLDGGQAVAITSRYDIGSGGGQIGTGSNDKFWKGYFYLLYYGTHGSYDDIDDIELIRQMKPDKDNPKKMDNSTIPKILKHSAKDTAEEMYQQRTVHADWSEYELLLDIDNSEDMNEVQKNIARRDTKKKIKEDKEDAERLKKEDLEYEGEELIDVGEMLGLATGAIRQLADKVDTLLERIEELEKANE